jgi:hypothetical protein
MALGKKTGGRKLGSANKRTRDIADKAAESGTTPLEYMLTVMRSPIMPELKEALDKGQLDENIITRLSGWHKMRYEAAKDAAPYIHPRLQSTTVKGSGDDGEIVTKLKIEYVGPDSSAPR